MSEEYFDAYVPSQMAERAKASGIRKAKRDFLSALFLAIQAGAFIAFGAAFYTLVTHDSAAGAGLTQLIGGVAFSLGLILVVVAGADLFTGDTLMVMASFSRAITIRAMLRSWSIVFTGNLLGALAIVFLVYFSGHWQANEGAVGLHALAIATHKITLPFGAAFASGMLCNVLVCLALWLCYSARSLADKVAAILFPISAFVAMGFEHSIANMYFLPAGLLLAHDPLFASGNSVLSLSSALGNLVPVVLGNMVGGAIFVGTVYWILYLRRGAPETKTGADA